MFEYLYRDASNYKQWGRVTFEDRGGLGLDSLDRRLLRAMMIDSTFVADQIRLPEIFLFSSWHVDVDDHCLHEFNSLEIVAQPPNDLHQRSILQFVQEVERASVQGWYGFVPANGDAWRRKIKLEL
jgi:hypothetical protein